MTQAPIAIGGFPLPSDAPAFLTLLAVHVAAGLTCVIAGIVAMLSQKRPGPHPRFGTIYFQAQTIVFVTMGILAAMRWSQDYYLFILGALSFAAALLGRQTAPSRRPGHVRLHLSAMGLSYILLLTAFYVDNGRNLPLWKSLPPIAYWLGPLAIGAPIIARTLLRHPLVRAESLNPRPGGAA